MSFTKVTKDMSDTLFEKCYIELKDKLDAKLNFSNFIGFIVTTMELVETYKTLNGLQKKQLVLFVCDRVVEESEYPEDLKDNIQTVIKNIGPNVIDALIIASKGKLILNAKKQCMKSFKSCLS